MKKTTKELLEEMAQARDFESYWQRNQEQFVKTSLAQILKEKRISKKIGKSEIIKRGNLDKSYGYQIFKGRKCNPSRNITLQLAFGMTLNAEETQELLTQAGHVPLDPHQLRDSILLYALIHKESVITCNERLQSFGQKLL